MLIKVGLQQPKLAPFPINKNVSSTKQCQFNSDWYLRILIFTAVLKTMVDLVLCANCFRPGLKEKRMRVLG